MAQAKIKVDGGLAVIEDKQAPARNTPILPPGALSARHMQKHCTACQLCVSACKNNVLRPSADLLRLMQPEMSYERGYCRPECTDCSQVCPTDAIRPITREEKTSIHIGHAVWIAENCVPVSNGDPCGACARHCPALAIQMVPYTTAGGRTVQVPAIDKERCIGCGKCENLCPSRPLSAIYVEGNEVQHVG
jgi:formate hydrogenlyase subunit 6/NADH:ubiquinone oxidoreductase subunit I